MSRGALTTAIGYAVRAAAMNPLDENHQSLLIRLYRMAGDEPAAARQFTAFRETLQTELGVAPSAAVAAAISEPLRARAEASDHATISALVEAGAAAVSAGAIDAGIHSLRTAVGLADQANATQLRVSSRLLLAEALIHSVRGLDQAGLASLHEADQIAAEHDLPDAVAQARAELGYVDFLRARYDRAEFWLNEARTSAADSPSTLAKATTYLGSVHSDRADYDHAWVLLGDAVRLSRAAGDLRREAYATSMLGRVSLLRQDLDVAAEHLDASIRLVEREHWLAFLPWPQALRGEVQLARGDPAGAQELLEPAFAMACHLGDSCWEGISARGLARVAGATGDISRAFEILLDARSRCNRLADPYVWLDAYILDALCELGLQHGHPDVRRWVDTLQSLAARTGMRELAVRSLLHGAALGNDGDGAAATLLAADIDSPPLRALLR